MRFRPDAVLFDMDGLLVDSEPLWFRVESAFARERGGDWTHELALGCVGRGMAATIETMGKTFSFDVDPVRDTNVIVDTFISRVAELELKPGATALLDRARGRLPVALASSSPMRLIQAVVTRFDIANRFDVLITGESVPHPKPAPDIFLRAAELVRAAPARCVVLEDSIAGATAGRRAGMFVIAVPEGSPEGRGFEAVADCIVPSLVEADRLLDIS